MSTLRGTTYTDPRYNNFREITEKELAALGVPSQVRSQLRTNKEKRENRALAIMKESGVPSDRWPRFKKDVYHIEEDLTGDLLEDWKDVILTNMQPITSIAEYVYPNKDQSFTNYPFEVSPYLPPDNATESPINKVIEIFTDEDGNPIITDKIMDDLLDLYSFSTSSANTKGLEMYAISKRSPYINGKIYTPEEIKANPSIQKSIEEKTARQLVEVQKAIDTLKAGVGGRTGQAWENVIVSREGADYPRWVNSKGVALSDKGGADSTFHKENNVVIVSLGGLTVYDNNGDVYAYLPGSGAEADKDPITTYDYHSGTVPLTYKSKQNTPQENYEKYYKDTKASIVMPVSGVNIQVVFEFPSNSAHKSVYLYMPDMITVSHSVHRVKVPVTTLGETTTTGIGLGTKMVAGSIVKLFGRRDPFHNYIKLFVDARSSKMSQERKASLVSLRSNISLNEVSDHMRDDIGPFNIHLISTSEHDCVYKDPPKVDSILGCTIINTGKVYSVENLITEETLSFMAKTVVYHDDMAAPVVQNNVSESVTTGSDIISKLRGGV